MCGCTNIISFAQTLHAVLLFYLQLHIGFICTYPGKSWLTFMFSYTNRWFFFCTGTTSCLFLHMQLLLFLFICAHPGKSWLGFMFSCTNRWFFAQALHPVYFCIMVGLFARIQAKVGLDPCLVAQESVLLCRDHIQLYLLLHVPSSFNYGEDRRRFVADPVGKGRGK